MEVLAGVQEAHFRSEGGPGHEYFILPEMLPKLSVLTMPAQGRHYLSQFIQQRPIHTFRQSLHNKPLSVFETSVMLQDILARSASPILELQIFIEWHVRHFIHYLTRSLPILETLHIFISRNGYYHDLDELRKDVDWSYLYEAFSPFLEGEEPSSSTLDKLREIKVGFALPRVGEPESLFPVDICYDILDNVLMAAPNLERIEFVALAQISDMEGEVDPNEQLILERLVNGEWEERRFAPGSEVRRPLRFVEGRGARQ